MGSRLFSLWLGFVLAVGFVGPCLGSPDSDERTLARIRSCWLQARESIQSISLRHVSHSYVYPDYPKGTYARVEMATRRDGSYFHDSSKGSEAGAWQDYTARQVAYVSPTRVVNVFPFNRSFFEHPIETGDGLPGSHRNNFFCVATGIWPFAERMAPRREEDVPLMPHEVFAESAELTVHPELVTVEGRSCVRIDHAKLDRLYLDVERNFCLVQREFLDKTSGDVEQRFVLLGHQELATGVWVPQVILNQRSSDKSTESLRESRIEIETCQVNTPLSDSVFQFEPPQGSVQLNQMNRFDFPEQVKEGGLDHLDHLIDWMGREDLVAQTQKSFGIRKFWPVLLFVCLVLINEARLLFSNRKSKASL